LDGLYFLDSFVPRVLSHELDYNEQHFSVLKDTIYEAMLGDMFQNKCPSSVIMRVPLYFDELMSTKKCPRLYKFLAYDEFDMEKVQNDIDREIPEAYHYTREVIEDIF
jgi:hypothetical protein